MNTLKDAIPPISAPGLGCSSEEPVIGVRILIPDSALPAPIAQNSHQSSRSTTAGAYGFYAGC